MTIPVAWELAGLGASAAILAAAGVRVVLRRRMPPQKREQRRRLAVTNGGRLHDGVITEFTETAVYYTYSVAGVAYHASQDISQLLPYLPEDPVRLIGPVWLKYTPRNPADSIVVSERWSGFRTTKEMQSR